MPSTINLLDASFGIQNVLDMPETGRLPQAREMASTALSEAGLSELYAPSNARQLIEDALCPEVGDGSLLSPEAFAGNLRGCLASLKDSDDPAVLALIRDELKPLLQNGELLQAYLGLMIGG